MAQYAGMHMSMKARSESIQAAGSTWNASEVHVMQAVQAGEGMRVGGARKAILPPELVSCRVWCDPHVAGIAAF